jgi:hypothetical protein
LAFDFFNSTLGLFDQWLLWVVTGQSRVVHRSKRRSLKSGCPPRVKMRRTRPGQIYSAMPHKTGLNQVLSPLR